MAMTSSAVVAGTNATATQYNNLRTDVQNASKRGFTWFLEGTSAVGNEAGAKYVVPEAMTVIAILHKVASGTATIRLQKDTTDIDASISATSTYGEETTITSAALAKGQVLSLDLTAASSPVDLSVTLECQVFTA